MGNWLSTIPGSQLVDLARRLGIPLSPDHTLDLMGIVLPVAIVDVGASFPVTTTTPIWGTPASQGEVVAPIADALLADTGQLAAGNWTFLILMGWLDATANSRLRIEHRDAANAANIWRQNVPLTTTGVMGFLALSFSKSFVQNERLRVINVLAQGAGQVNEVNIFSLQL